MNDLRAVRERREALVGAAATLEAALAGPAYDARWPEVLGTALAELRETLDDHVHATEAPGGTIDQMRERAPRLSTRIEHLVDQHASMTADIGRLADQLDHLRTDRTRDETAQLRNQALELLGTIAHHRQLGADLLYEAYDVDLGGPG